MFPGTRDQDPAPSAQSENTLQNLSLKGPQMGPTKTLLKPLRSGATLEAIPIDPSSIIRVHLQHDPKRVFRVFEGTHAHTHPSLPQNLKIPFLYFPIHGNKIPSLFPHGFHGNKIPSLITISKNLLRHKFPSRTFSKISPFQAIFKQEIKGYRTPSNPPP